MGSRSPRPARSRPTATTAACRRSPAPTGSSRSTPSARRRPRPPAIESSPRPPPPRPSAPTARSPRPTETLGSVDVTLGCTARHRQPAASPATTVEVSVDGGPFEPAGVTGPDDHHTAPLLRPARRSPAPTGYRRATRSGRRAPRSRASPVVTPGTPDAVDAPQPRSLAVDASELGAVDLTLDAAGHRGHRRRLRRRGVDRPGRNPGRPTRLHRHRTERSATTVGCPPSPAPIG